MYQIVLTTQNARYIHSSLALRCLKANLAELAEQARILEFTIKDRPLETAEKILAHNPEILGLGVYIWNADVATQLVRVLKRLRPGLVIVLGGPEVSHETDEQEIVKLADYVVAGEGEIAFAGLAREILSGNMPQETIIKASVPDLENIILPYDHYTEEDIAHRMIYLEASRGCPFRCDFCLSSLDRKVRRFDSRNILLEITKLFDRGVRHFRFVDRSFELGVTSAMLEFFLQHSGEGIFLHLELGPDRIKESFRKILARFPQGTLQIEAGIQSFNSEVLYRINRTQDTEKTIENLEFLKSSTKAHIHSDLIVGLPGETIESFAEGFDRLMSVGPQEIQVGILKKLRGTAIGRHDEEWRMVYNPIPPYEILANRLIDFETMTRLRRFSRYFDLVHNSGRFPLLCARLMNASSYFNSFMAFSDWLYEKTGRTYAISPKALQKLLAQYLVEIKGLDKHEVQYCFEQDQHYSRKKSPGPKTLAERQHRHMNNKR